MKTLKAFSTAACATLALFALGSAQALVITGDLWHVPEVTSQTAPSIPSSPPAGSTTFTVTTTFDTLNFLGATGGTVSAFLNTPGNGIGSIVYGSAGPAASLMDNCAPGPTDCSSTTGTALGTFIRFLGTDNFFTGETFVVSHDDGVRFSIGGVAVTGLGATPGPSPQTGTYSGPGGVQPFEFVYGECCGGGALLNVTISPPIPTPEPATLTLFGLGLAGLALVRRRKTS